LIDKKQNGWWWLYRPAILEGFKQWCEKEHKEPTQEQFIEYMNGTFNIEEEYNNGGKT
jgi:hypothetical protein